MILPALTEAVSPFFRPIKYSLFPPLGLATLAAYLDENDEIVIQDEHVEKLTVEDDPSRRRAFVLHPIGHLANERSRLDRLLGLFSRSLHSRSSVAAPVRRRA